jgi:hypothetical protein
MTETLETKPKKKRAPLGGLPPSGSTKPRKAIRDRDDYAQIQAELLDGKSVRAISKKYGVHEGALYKHRAKMPAALKASALGQRLKPGCDLEEIRKEESEGLLLSLAQQRVRLIWQQDAAIADGNHQAVATLASGIHRNLELVGRMVGELNQHVQKTTVNILMSADYLRLRTALVKALQPYPDAARAVAAALYAAESAAAQDIAAPPVIDVTPALGAPDDDQT